MLACGCGRLSFDPLPDADGALAGDAVLSPVTFGNTTIETQGPDTHPPGSAEASSYYATQSGVVDQLVVYYAAPSDDAAALIIGLYTDDGAGNPGTLLAGGEIRPGGQLTRQTWHALQIPETPITAGLFYWIAAACPAGSGNACSFQYKYYGQTGVGPCSPLPTQQCTQHSVQSNLTTMPATWSAGDVFWPSINSYYATHD
jgi:hypothetical protein